MNANRIDAAIDLATRAHGTQERKYTGEPYVVHTRAVAARVAHLLDDDAVIAAHLHDAVEDTALTLDVIRDQFGDRVARLVALLTDPPVTVGMNRAARKERTYLRFLLAQGQDAIDAHTIKLADLLDNAASIRSHDANFWKVYRAEAARLVGALVLGHPGLKDAVCDAIGIARIKTRATCWNDK